MAPPRDPYELLGLDRTAEASQVKRAYRRLAKRYHPDATHDDGRLFVALRSAYETLSDPERRREWERRHPSSGRRPATGSPASPPARPGTHAADGSPGTGAAPGLDGRWRSRDARGRFVRSDARPWWEEIRGGRSVGADVPGSRGDPHLGPSSSGAAWSSAARAYFRRLTRQESGAERRARRGQPGRAR